MTKAAELAKMGEVITNSQIGGRRNIVINGAMQVAQRGTSFSLSGTADTFITDRFLISNSDTGAWTASQSTDSPTGFSNSLKMDCTTADTSPTFLTLMTRFEGQDLQHLKKGTSSAEKTTLSFFVKSNKTGTYIAELRDIDNNRTIGKAYTISSADTWEQKIITFDGDTTGAFGNDNGNSLQIIWYLAVGSVYNSGTLATSWGSRVNANTAVGQVNLADSTDNEWYITGIQLEVGSQATPFEHRSFGEELALCQRYYERYETSGANYARFGLFQCTSTTTAFGAIDYKVSKRSASVTLDTELTRLALSDSDNSMLPVTAIAIDSNCNSFENTSVTITASGGGLVAGECTQLLSENFNNGYIAIDAELYELR